MSATPGLGRYRALKRTTDAHIANVSNPHSVTAAQLGLTGPMDYKGTVAAAADFPTLAAVGTGDTYRCSSPCTDNDATKTNTLQSFITGEELIWNGTGWDVFEGDLTPAAQVAGSGTAGTTIPITAGAGAAAATAVAGAVGGALTLAAGAGGASDGTDAAAAGGAATLTAGAGGAAHTAVAGANGANATLAGGVGGAGSAGALAGNGGNAVVNAGHGGATGGFGAGTDGVVQIGSASTSAVQIGNTTDNPTATFLGTGTVTIPTLLVNGRANQAVTPAAQVAGGGTVGANVTATAGAGSAAVGAAAGAVGGAATVAGGVGGASDGTGAAANGGTAAVRGGAGGAAHTAVVGGIGATATLAGGAGGAGSAGASGGAGGNAIVNAGAGGVTGGGGAGADGNVQIGSADTAAIQIGNVTDNPATTFLGTGTVTIPNLLVNGLAGQAITPSAQAAGGGTAGANVRTTAGAGSAAGGAVGGAVGGTMAATGGAGGDSDGTNASAAGGVATLTGGVGGAAHTAIIGSSGGNTTVAGGAGGAGSAGAAGGAGGYAILNAGPGGVTGGGGAGADGLVQIASADTLRVEIGNATDNPVVQMLGTGNLNLLGGGDILNKRLVRVDIVATGGVGGATAGTISVQVKDLAGTNIAGVFDLELHSSLTQYAGMNAATSTAFFGAATAGAINAGTGTLWAHVTTDATGLYEGALADNADETAWFSASTATGGVTNLARGCVVVTSVPNDATWSA